VLIVRDDFCILIPSFNRAGNIPTIKTLEKHGYTGDWYIVIDNEEDKEPYFNEYGEENVYYFDKDDVVDRVDRIDNFDDRNANMYFRNISFDIAKELGYKYFAMFDDDYTNFNWRFDSNYNYDFSFIEDLDLYIEEAIKYLEESGLHTICMAQGGDYIGGEESQMAQKVRTKRKAMNTFICKVDRPIEFKGTINEDVNAYVREQQLGKTMLTVSFASVLQEETQQKEGGLTDIYLDRGTYIKSFYTVILSPSSVSLSLMGNKYMRIHHKVDWNASVPKILPEEYKK